MADLDAYYQVLCKGQKDYHNGHFGDLCDFEKDQLIEKCKYNPKEKSDKKHEPVLSELPTEIIDLILVQCDEVDAACLSLTWYYSLLSSKLLANSVSKRFHDIYVKHHGPYPPLTAGCEVLSGGLDDGETTDAWYHRRCSFYSRIASVRKIGREELMPSELYYCRPCGKFHGPVTGRVDLNYHDVPAELPPGWVIRKRQGRYPEAFIRKSLVGRVKEWASG